MIVRCTAEVPGGVLNGRVMQTLGDATTVTSVRTSRVDLNLDDGRLALIASWRGRLELSIGGRSFNVDEDCWIATDEPMTVRLRGESDAHLTVLQFERGWPEEILRGLVTPEDQLLERGEDGSGLPFVPHLFSHDRSVTNVLQFIRRHCEQGLCDPVWYEEQLSFLLERMLLSHRQLTARLRSIPARRAATRREILRRILLATDFIHASYARPLALRDIAGAACLSRHHFLRLFKCVQGITPHEYLQRKRAGAAVRMLRQTSLSVEEIVRQVGFDSRSTLFRALRRFHGVTPRECRKAVEPVTQARPVFVPEATAILAAAAT